MSDKPLTKTAIYEQGLLWIATRTKGQAADVAREILVQQKVLEPKPAVRYVRSKSRKA
jgi:hypothetical protein